MAVDDIRLAIDMDHNVKVLRLEKELGPGATWSLVRLWLYTARHRPEGALTGISLDEIEPLIGWKRRRGRLIEALERLGFITVNDTGTSREVTIHDWPVHQPWVSGHKRRSEVARENVSRRWAKRDPGSPQPPEKNEVGPTDRSTGRNTSGNTDGNTDPILLSDSFPNPSPSPASVDDSRTGPLDGPSASSDDTPEARQARKAFLRQAAEKIGAEHLLPGNGEDKSGGEGKTRLDTFIGTLAESEKKGFILANNRFRTGAITLEDALVQLEVDGLSESQIAEAEAILTGGKVAS